MEDVTKQNAAPGSLGSVGESPDDSSLKSSRQSPESINGLGPPLPTPTKSKTSSAQNKRTSGKQKIHLDTQSLPSKYVYTPNGQSTVQLREEQAYLLATLPSQNQRAAGYMGLLSELQEKLRSGELPSDQRRKTKKKISMTRKKIAEASEQQRVILGRLGELFVELQNRERWAQLMGGPMSAVSDWYYMDSPMTPWTGAISTPSDMTPMISPRLPLDATTTEFIPMGYFGFPPDGAYHQPYSPSWSLQPGDVEPHASSTNTGSSVMEPWEDEDTGVSQPSKSDYDGLDPPMCEDCLNDADIPEEDDPCSPFSPRRQSVPCIKSEWPENRVQEMNSKIGGGGEDVEIILQHSAR